MIEFFRFFAKDFAYSHQVISIRSEDGIVSKNSKGWLNEVRVLYFHRLRTRNKRIH